MKRSRLARLATVALLATGCGTAHHAAPGPTPTGPATPTAPASATPSLPHVGPTPGRRTGPPSPAGPTSPVGPTTTAPGSPTTASPGSTQVTKLLVFVVENHSLDQMQSQMPFVASIAQRYGYADHYEAITHPSLPNYLAIASGSTFGVTDDGPPASHPLPGASVFGDAIRHGSTAGLYAESMPSPCQSEPQGTYAVKHNPWAYFPDEASLCRQGDLPLSAFGPDVRQGQLPAVGMVIPNLCEDAHDCSLAHADSWLRTYVGQAMSGPDWDSGHLAVVITADEDDTAHGNRVLTVVAQPSLRHAVVSAPLNHYSLDRAYTDVAGVPPLREGANAADLLHSFGLTTQ